MSKKFSLPRGTADILPGDVVHWENVESSARQAFKVHNYREIRTPFFEETELFARSMGQTTEVVQKQMLRLMSQKEEDSGQFALRPEGTASVLRSYIQNNLDKKEHLTKLFYIGPMFRGERPQKGRLRQFHQIGAEAIGPGSASALLDAEMISLAVRILTDLGLSGFELNINTLGTQEDRKNFAVWLKEQLAEGITSLDPDLQESFNQNVFRILDSKDKKAKALVAGLTLDRSYLSAASQEYFHKVLSALDGMGIAYNDTPSLVRGLDYYTQTVFEISDKSLGSQDALGAGGRYSNLAAQIGGSDDVDAVGFALGIERILLALNEKESVAPQAPSYYIIALDEGFASKAFLLLDILRKNRIPSDMNYRQGSVKSQMRAANKSGAKFVALLGEDEIMKNEVTIKNMESGTQETVSLENFESYIRENH